MQTQQDVPQVDPTLFRQTLGHYPTGVAVVATRTAADEPIGLTVGSFTSVSLAPPLVGFFPGRSSTTWPAMAPAGRFAVSVLTRHQHALCAAFATSGGNKFDGVAWHPSESGNPVLDDAAVWLDCVTHAVHDAGDHYFVLGRVLDLGVSSQEQPLIFHRGRFHSCAALEDARAA